MTRFYVPLFALRTKSMFTDGVLLYIVIAAAAATHCLPYNGTVWSVCLSEGAPGVCSGPDLNCIRVVFKTARTTENHVARCSVAGRPF
jgi:hypothetical protein